MFLVYNCLLTLLAPIWVVWMILRAKRRKEAPNWAERQGQYNLALDKDRPRVWIHAVSVGEVVAAMPILRELQRQLPKVEIVLSVTTSSGHQTARERAAELYDHLIYAPIDVARFALGAMQRIQPKVFAIMETELWFNLLWAAKTFDTQTLLINGRISDRNFKRSRYLGFFYRPLLKLVDRCLMQTEGDAERIRFLGAPTVEVLGNCKFDQALEGIAADPLKWRADLNIEEDRPIIVVGSIRTEEFSFLAEVIHQHPRPCWIVAPRHLERLDELQETLRSVFGQSAGPKIGLRSKGEGGDIILMDTYGELASVYSVADIVIVGGGFAKLGGQNILQPLAHGKPVLHGPYMTNFRDVAAMAVAVGASEICRTKEDVSSAITRLLDDPRERERRGKAAADLVQANLGASARYAAAIVEATKVPIPTRATATKRR